MTDWFTPETWQWLSYFRLAYNSGFVLVNFFLAYLCAFIEFIVDDNGNTVARRRQSITGGQWLMAILFAGLGANALGESAIFLFFSQFTLGYILSNVIGRFPVFVLSVTIAIAWFGSNRKGITEFLAAEYLLKKQAEDAQMLADKYKRVAEENQQLLSIASHDLNSPSKGILGSLRTLNAGIDLTAEERTELLTEMEIAAKMVCDRIDGLAEYNKSRHLGHHQPRIDMNELIDQLVNVLEVDIVKAEGDVTHGNLLPVSGSQVHISQMFQNLILNGLKYRRDNVAARVHISSRPADKKGFVEFIVSDNGIGFAHDQSEKIFELYRSAHKSRMGTGVGLTIVKNIVTAHSGSIYAVSVPNGGASFYLTLPQAH